MADVILFDAERDSKQCRLCLDVRPISEFRLDRRDGGRGNTCWPCRQHKQRIYKSNNADKVRGYGRRSYAKMLARPKLAPAVKTCSGCNIDLPIASFGSCKSSRDGHRGQCKSCRQKKEYAYIRSDAGKETRRKSYLAAKKKHGTNHFRWAALLARFKISRDDYTNLFEKQRGECGICGTKNEKVRGKIVSLAVDHCHSTNKVRGLLCGKCNRALGLLGDSEEGIEKALNYLRAANAL